MICHLMKVNTHYQLLILMSITHSIVIYLINQLVSYLKFPCTCIWCMCVFWIRHSVKNNIWSKTSMIGQILISDYLSSLVMITLLSKYVITQNTKVCCIVYNKCQFSNQMVQLHAPMLTVTSYWDHTIVLLIHQRNINMG